MKRDDLGGDNITGVRLLNPIYKQAWEAQGTPENGYHYADPDKIEPTGARLSFPCLFRLLRTEDMTGSDDVNDYYIRRETFLLAVKVNDYPASDEEEIEAQAIRLAVGFLKELRKDSCISFTMPSRFSWDRRNLQQFAICLIFSIDVKTMGERIWC